MAIAAAIPVFMRLGDGGTEYEIGSLTPDLQIAPLEGEPGIGQVWAEIDIGTPLAALLREAADDIEKVTRGHID